MIFNDKFFHSSMTTKKKRKKQTTLQITVQYESARLSTMFYDSKSTNQTTNLNRSGQATTVNIIIMMQCLKQSSTIKFLLPTPSILSLFQKEKSQVSFRLNISDISDATIHFVTGILKLCSLHLANILQLIFISMKVTSTQNKIQIFLTNTQRINNENFHPHIV